MKENKGQRKEAEDNGVFLRFGDDLAVDDNSNRAVGLRRKTRPRIARSTPIIVCSRKEVPDGFVQDARAHPRRSISAGIVQSRSGDTNSHLVVIGIIIHEKMGNGSAATAGGDGWGVRGAGGKSDIGSASARNSGSHRVDVYRVGARKQGRELKVGIGGLVGVEEVSVIGRPEFPSVSIVANGGAYSDVTAVVCGRRAAKNPKGLVGGVVLAGIDVDEQLRIRSPPPPRRGRRRPLIKTISVS